MERISNTVLWLTFAVFIHSQIVDVVLGQAATPTQTVQIVSSGDLSLGITVSSSSNDSSIFELTFTIPLNSPFMKIHTQHMSNVWFSVGFQNGAEEGSQVFESSPVTMTGPRGADYLFLLSWGITSAVTAHHRKLDKNAATRNGLPGLVEAEIGSSNAWIQRLVSSRANGRLNCKLSLACTPREQASQIVNFAEPVTVLFATGLTYRGEPLQHAHNEVGRSVVLRQNSTSTTLCPPASGSTPTKTESSATAASSSEGRIPITARPSTNAPRSEASSTTVSRTTSKTHTQDSTRSSSGQSATKTSVWRQPFSPSFTALATIIFIVCLFVC